MFFAGHLFVSGPCCEHPTLACTAPERCAGVVWHNEEPCPVSVVWLLGNLFFDGSTALRISHALLNRMATAYAAVSQTCAAAMFLDPRLHQPGARSWPRAAGRVPAPPKGECASPRHRPGRPPRCNDDRFANRCRQCGDEEMLTEQATWPTFEGLTARVIRPFAIAIRRAFAAAGLRVTLLELITGRPGVDLRLSHVDLPLRLVAFATPHTDLIKKIRNSKQRVNIEAGLASLFTQGYVRLIKQHSNRYLQLTPLIERHLSVLITPGLVDLARRLARHRPSVALVAPGVAVASPGWIGPVNLLCWNDVASRLSGPNAIIYGWRCGARCPRFEVAVAVAAAVGCHLSAVGPAHYSDTVDHRLRLELEAEAAMPWKDVATHQDLITTLVGAGFLTGVPDGRALKPGPRGVSRAVGAGRHGTSGDHRV